MSELVVSLDVGSTRVTALIGQVTPEGRVEILGGNTRGYDGMRKGAVVNIEATLQAINEVVESAAIMAGVRVKEVITGASGVHIQAFNSRGVVGIHSKQRQITEEDIARVHEAALTVSIPPDRTIFDCYPFRYTVDDQDVPNVPINMMGVRLEVDMHLYTGSSTANQNLQRCIERAGYRVQSIRAKSYASARAVATSDEREVGVMVVDIGGEVTDVVVFQKGSPVFSAIVPVGSNQVTADLSIILKIPQKEADRIKREKLVCHPSMLDDPEETVLIPGVGGQAPREETKAQLCAYIQPRMAELFQLIAQAMERESPDIRMGSLASGIILTGGGSMLSGAPELAQDVLNLPCRVGYVHKASGVLDDIKSPSYAVAVGLLIMAAEDQGIEPEQRSSAENKSKGDNKVLKWFKNFF